MKKTLSELLTEDKRYTKVNVKIGSRNGSSFWYCGKGNPIYSIPAIRNARTNLLRQSKGILCQLEYRLKNLDKIYQETLINSRKRKMKNREDYEKKLEIKKQREKITLPKKIASVQNDIDTHLLDRQVMEVVNGLSPDEKPCLIIYVKGNEKGAYWTIAEYNKRRKLDEKV